MPAQQRFEPPVPQLRLPPLALQPIDLVGHLLLDLAGQQQRPGPTASLGGQLGHDGGVFAVVLGGDAVEGLGVIGGGLGADAVGGQAGLLQGVPQGVAVGAGRLQGDDELASLSDALQELDEAGEVGGIAATPGPVEVVGGPAEDAEDVVLADIEAGVEECLASLLQEPLHVNLVDIDGAVCFAFHGDDLLYVDR